MSYTLSSRCSLSGATCASPRCSTNWHRASFIPEAICLVASKELKVNSVLYLERGIWNAEVSICSVDYFLIYLFFLLFIMTFSNNNHPTQSLSVCDMSCFSVFLFMPKLKLPSWINKVVLCCTETVFKVYNRCTSSNPILHFNTIQYLHSMQSISWPFCHKINISCAQLMSLQLWLWKIFFWVSPPSLVYIGLVTPLLLSWKVLLIRWKTVILSLSTAIIFWMLLDCGLIAGGAVSENLELEAS